MISEKERLLYEIGKLQDFIDHCELARDYGLGLSEDTFNKYIDAINDQKELSRQLAVLNANEDGIYTNAQLQRKESRIHTDKCKVEEVIELPTSQFYSFRHNLFDNYPFIKDNIDKMYIDENGTSHCLLVLGEGEEDGVLVESEGSLYARYSALLPNARNFIQKHIQTMVDDLIKQGTAVTSNGTWLIGFDEISQHFDTTITMTNGIGQMLIDELRERSEISEIIATEDSIEMTYSFEHESATNDVNNQSVTILDLINCASLEDVKLVHVDEDYPIRDSSYLNKDTFTDQGLIDWCDVLSAKVNRVFLSMTGIQIVVSGCDPFRLSTFRKMLNGECKLSESERWLNPVVEDEEFEMKFDEGGVR